MSSLLHRYLIQIYNFASILSLNKENGSYEVSNFKSFCNFLKMPIVITFISVYFIYFVPIDTQRVEEFKKFSTFSMVTMYIISTSTNIVGFLFAIFQVAGRYDMKSFINSWFEASLSKKYLVQFQKNCFIKDVALTSLFSIFAILQYLSTIEVTFMSLLATMILFYPNIIVVSVTSFVTSFQFFVAVSLKEFRQSFDEFSQKNSFEREQIAESYLQLSRKYQNLHDLVEQFNDCFGHSLTLMTCYITMTLTFIVR